MMFADLLSKPVSRASRLRSRLLACATAAALLSACAVQGEQAQLAANAPQTSTYDAILEAGNAKLTAGDYPAAVNLYRNAHNVNPDSSEPLQLMGLALAAGGAPEEATDAYRNALIRDPDDIEARRGLANALVAMDEPALSIPHYRLVLERAPSDYRGYLGLGVAYDLTGDHLAAKSVYESGLAESPGNIDLMHNMGLSAVLSGDVDLGVSLLQEVVKDPTSGAQQRQTLSMALVLAGRSDDARDVAALDLSPADIERNISYFQTIRGLADPADRLRAIRAYLGEQG